MASASVTLKETDLSTRVGNFPGISGFIVINSDVGPVMEPYLVTSESQLVEIFGEPNPKNGSAHYSALTYLTQSDKLWAVRIAPNAKFGGVIIKTSASSNDNEALTEALKDLNGYTFSTDDSVLITSANQGSWSSNISVTITDSTDYSDASNILVFKDGEQVEKFIVSRKHQKDGYGKQMYIEDVINGNSFFIQVKDNLSVDESEGMKVSNYLSNSLSLSSGDNGDAPTVSNYMKAVDLVSNPEEYNVTLFMDGGVTHPSYHQYLINICESRINSFAILSTSITAENNANYIQGLKDFRSGMNINNSYGAVYSSHQLIYDKYNDVKVVVSPDGFVASRIARTTRVSEIWEAAAGWGNGNISVISSNRVYSKGERDVLYDIGINPMRSHPTKGIAIWGQKTLQTTPSALDRVNVRMLLISIEPPIIDFLDNYEFKLNSELTRLQIENGVVDLMSDIKSRGGVYDFLAVCDESNNTPVRIDNNELYFDLYVKPVKTAEFITFRAIVTRTGTDFSAVKLG